jgi:hypothetical protein
VGNLGRQDVSHPCTGNMNNVTIVNNRSEELRILFGRTLRLHNGTSIIFRLFFVALLSLCRLLMHCPISAVSIA